jgi:tetratricopeptide (TPR) repeat protein
MQNAPQQSPSKARWFGLGALAFVALLAGISYWLLRETDGERARRYLAEARSLRRAGEYARAEELAWSAFERDPALTEAALLAARCAVAQKKFENALGYARQVDAGDTAGRIEALMLIAEVAQGQLYHLSAAEEAYRSVLAIDPDNFQANAELARLLGICGRGREAVPFVLKNVQLGRPSDQLILIARESGAISDLPMLKAALESWPQDPNVFIGLAWHAASDGRDSEAARLLKTAVAAQPEHPAVYVALGRQFLVQGLFEELADWVNRPPPGAEDFGETWFLRGRLAEHQKNAEAAIRCYWESIKRAPESKESNFRISKLLLAADAVALAEPFAVHIRRIDHLRTLQDRMMSHGPSDGLVIDLAKAYEDTGRIWEAFGWCLLAGSSRSANRELAALFERLGKRTESLPLQQTADSANPALKVDLSLYPLPEFHSVASTSVARSAYQPASVSFRDDAASTGLVFRFFNGSATPTRRMFELTGGGIGVLDYDLDGYSDVYFSQGCPWPPSAEGSEYKDQIFRNHAGRRFENVSHLAGLAPGGFGQGVAVGDYNSDGFPDLYLARVGANCLWVNNGDGTFSDVTGEAGLSGDEWTTSCLLADLNGDGHPDLYDVNYLMGENVFERVCRHANGMKIQCLPFDFEGQPDRLWLNSGEGGFVDGTASSLSVIPDGKGLGILAWDAHGTGRLSLLIANDTTPNFFFTQSLERRDKFHLVEQGLVSGLAFNGQGKAEGCMGIALGDVDANGFLDVHVTNFLAESNTLWLCESPGFYEDKTQETGLREPTLEMLGFGTQFLDANLDGRLELFVANGHVDDLRAIGKPYAMPPQLFQWDRSRFQESNPERLGPYFQKNWVGRAVARLDWNRDGLEDLVVGHLFDDAALLTNNTPNPGRFLALKLTGTKSSRDSVGASVQMRIGERTWVQQLTAGDGYQASNSRELVFGAGEAETVDELVIHWPSGRKQPFENVSTNKHWILVEGGRLLELHYAARGEIGSANVRWPHGKEVSYAPALWFER